MSKYTQLELLNKIWAKDDTYLLIVREGKLQVLFSLTTIEMVQIHAFGALVFDRWGLRDSSNIRTQFGLYITENNALIYGVQKMAQPHNNTWFYYLGNQLEVNPDPAMLTQAMQECAQYLQQLESQS